MSRSCEVQLVIFFVETLFKTIKEIGLAREEVKHLETCSGEMVDVDFVLKNEHGDKIGVKTLASGETHLIAADPDCASTKKSLNKIKQTYARIKVLEELQRKGYRLTKEENMTDGTVRMVVQRWQ